jgi:hypothetical protein
MQAKNIVIGLLSRAVWIHAASTSNFYMSAIAITLYMSARGAQV